jgi:hypothetical protein
VTFRPRLTPGLAFYWFSYDKHTLNISVKLYLYIFNNNLNCWQGQIFQAVSNKKSDVLEKMDEVVELSLSALYPPF